MFHIRKLLNLIVIVSALAVILYVAFVAIDSYRSRKLRNKIVNPYFETGNLIGWTKTGDAFNYQPTLGNNPKERKRESSNNQGNWWIGSFEKYQGKPGQKPGDVQGDEPTGTLTSKPFIISGDTISFLIGGGNHPWVEPNGTGSTCVNLLIEGKVVKTATGKNYETMTQCSWNVSKFKGKNAVIQLVDRNKGHWGHINFDFFQQMTKWQTQRGDFILYLWFAGLILLAALTKCV